VLFQLKQANFSANDEFALKVIQTKLPPLPNPCRPKRGIYLLSNFGSFSSSPSYFPPSSLLPEWKVRSHYSPACLFFRRDIQVFDRDSLAKSLPLSSSHLLMVSSIPPNALHHSRFYTSSTVTACSSTTPPPRFPFPYLSFTRVVSSDRIAQSMPHEGQRPTAPFGIGGGRGGGVLLLFFFFISWRLPPFPLIVSASRHVVVFCRISHVMLSFFLVCVVPSTERDWVSY